LATYAPKNEATAMQSSGEEVQKELRGILPPLRRRERGIG